MMLKHGVLQSRVLNALRGAEGRFVTCGELIEAVYYADECSDEPDWAEGCIRLAINFLRKRGFPIDNVAWRGYRFVPTTSKRLLDLVEAEPVIAAAA